MVSIAVSQRPFMIATIHRTDTFSQILLSGKCIKIVWSVLFWFWQYLKRVLIWHVTQSSIKPSIHFSSIVKSGSNPYLEPTCTKQWEQCSITITDQSFSKIDMTMRLLQYAYCSFFYPNFSDNTRWIHTERAWQKGYQESREPLFLWLRRWMYMHVGHKYSLSQNKECK